MQIIIQALPPSSGSLEVQRQEYRHWMVFPDGRIYIQTEIVALTVDGWKTESRSEWEKLLTPPMSWEVAGVIDHGGLPMAILKNGRAYIWGRAEGEPIQRWVPFEDPIPDTPAYREYIT